MEMTYKQMKRMISFHKSAEEAFEAVGNMENAGQAKRRRLALEREAHALELFCFEWAWLSPVEVLNNPPAYFDGVADGAFEFSALAVLAMAEG